MNLKKIKRGLFFCWSCFNVIFLWMIIFVLCCSVYISHTWGTVSLPQLLFFIQYGVSGEIDLSLLLEIVGYCLLLPVALAIFLTYCVSKLNNGKLLFCNRVFFGGYLVFLWFAANFCMDLTLEDQYVFYGLLFVFYLLNQWRNYKCMAVTVTLLLLLPLVFFVVKASGGERLLLSVFDFRETDFYAQNYVHIDVKRLVNHHRRNVIVIFGESLESKYLILNDNHQHLAIDDDDAIKFSDFTEGYSQRWTQGALFSAFTGVHIHYLSDFFRYQLYDKFKNHEGKYKKLVFSYLGGRDCDTSNVSSLGDITEAFEYQDYDEGRDIIISNFIGNDFDFDTPNISYLGDITKAFGYQNLFVQGGSLAFSGTDKFLFKHGFSVDDVYDSKVFKNSEDAEIGKNWWGVSDKIVFDLFKIKLNELDKNSPFFAVLFTLDLHQGDNPFFRNIDEVKRATVQNLNDFIQWFKKQSFYDNTTLIILADHKRMGKTVQAGGGLYNAFFNLPADLKQNLNTNRSFNQIDIFPTVLEIAGFELPFRKAGVGVSLFARQKTLAEIFDYAEQESIFTKIDRFYQKLWLSEYLFSSPFSQGLALLEPGLREKVIAHAGRCLDNVCYKNDLKALNVSAERGYKYIELDLLKTKDKRIIAAHDWSYLSKQCGLAELLMHRKLDDVRALCLERSGYSLLDDESILAFFETHPNIYFVTDKIDDFGLLSEKFSLIKSRMIVEVFSEDKYKEAQKYGFPYIAYNIRGLSDFEKVLKNKYKVVTMNINFARKYKKKVVEIRKNGVQTLLYSVKSLKDIQDNADVGDVFYYDGEDNLI